MTTLTIIAVLATFPSVLAEFYISGTYTHYVNFTCKPPPYLGLSKLFSLKLVFTTKSHSLRSLLDVPREEHFNISVGDVPTLFSHGGKVIESDAASSFLMASFPLTEDLYGNYSCVTSYEPLVETGSKEHWTHLQIDGLSVNPKESGGFRANFRQAYKVNARWLLREVERKSTITISRHMQNNTTSRQELVICKLEKDQPHCFTFPVVSDYKLSYSDVVTLDFITIEDARMNYVINISECTLGSCSRELCTLPTDSNEHFLSAAKDCDCAVPTTIMTVVIVVLVLVIVIILFVFRKIICCRQCRRNRRGYIMNNGNRDKISPIYKLESNDDESSAPGGQPLLDGELSSSSLQVQQDHTLSTGGQRNSSSPGRHQRGSGAQQKSSPTRGQSGSRVQQNSSSPPGDQRGSGAQQNPSLLDGQQSSFPSAVGENELDGQQNYSTPTGGQNIISAQQNSSSPMQDQQNPLPPVVRGQSVQEDIPGVSERPASGDVDIH